MTKRLTWEKAGKVCVCYNADNDDIGYFEYERTGRFMHWCWHQDGDVRMSPGCLQEVRDKQKELASER